MEVEDLNYTDPNERRTPRCKPDLNKPFVGPTTPPTRFHVAYVDEHGVTRYRSPIHTYHADQTRSAGSGQKHLTPKESQKLSILEQQFSRLVPDTFTYVELHQELRSFARKLVERRLGQTLYEDKVRFKADSIPQHKINLFAGTRNEGHYLRGHLDALFIGLSPELFVLSEAQVKVGLLHYKRWLLARKYYYSTPEMVFHSGHYYQDYVAYAMRMLDAPAKQHDALLATLIDETRPSGFFTFSIERFELIKRFEQSRCIDHPFPGA